jgi:hypothetical protein
MTPSQPAAPRAGPHTPPDDAARADLRYIRDTIGRATTFTAVPGYGGVAMGVIGIVAAIVAARQDAVRPWLTVWLLAAVVAASAGAWATWRKARAGDEALFAGAGRKFVRGLAPALAAGAILTVAIAMLDARTPGLEAEVARASAASFRILPGMWLLLYGAGVAAAGAFSVRPVQLLGGLCMVAGACALAAPAAWGDAFLGAGFGLFQVVFGAVVVRRYGG